MSQQYLPRRSKSRFSLSVRVTLWLMGVAIFPLIITVAYSVFQSRPALITQANTAMQSDAQARVQLIDAYFGERLLDAQTLSQVPTVLQFLATPPSNTPAYQDLSVHAGYALLAGSFRDKHYIVWTLFDTQGQMRLYYPPTVSPWLRGQYQVPPAYLQTVSSGKSLISGVYLQPGTLIPFVDIYAPIFTTPDKQLLGIIRATLNLDYISATVADDQGVGHGSYAIILDEHGVRIVDPDATQRFKAVNTLDQQVQQQARDDGRYGVFAPGQIDVLQDTTLASHLHDPASQLTFQVQPTGQSQNFQAVQHTVSTMPWKYIVLSPSSTVTAVADQELFSIALIAFIMLLLAAIIGLIGGRRITYPILNSVNALRGNSQALTTLAVKQEDAASEQTWVVDSSQVGLQSIQYYTDATKVASHQLGTIGEELMRDLHKISARTAQQQLERMVSAARYIENASEFQADSNHKLSTALKVATQVSEQLATSSTSAKEAATQLEQVVEQLRHVMGK